MPDVVTLAARRRWSETAPISVALVAVITDRRGRVWLEHSRECDLWRLPNTALRPGTTPGREAIRAADGLGGALGKPRPLGAFRRRGCGTLMLAYHIETEGRSGEDGNFIPLDLAPLNIEPSHVEIAHRALTAGDGVDERLDIDDGETRLAFLRSDEREPPPCPVDLASFIEAANDRLTKSPERERARWLERLAELLILDGHPDSARSLLDEAVALAGDAGDLATMVNADIRLAELKDAEAGELRAWRWVAQLTWPRGRTHLEIPFLYLGSFALRRNRMREAEAYYRRALLLCDDPARGLSIRSAMATGFRPTVPA